jgi:hypothetical protein
MTWPSRDGPWAATHHPWPLMTWQERTYERHGFSNVERRLVLREVPLFRFVDTEYLPSLANICVEARHGHGEVVCEQGQPTNASLIVVAHGKLQAWRTSTRDGKIEHEHIGELQPACSMLVEPHHPWSHLAVLTMPGPDDHALAGRLARHRNGAAARVAVAVLGNGPRGYVRHSPRHTRTQPQPAPQPAPCPHPTTARATARDIPAPSPHPVLARSDAMRARGRCGRRNACARDGARRRRSICSLSCGAALR